MPQLAPLNWLFSLLLVLLICALLLATFWWRRPLVFPAPHSPTSSSLSLSPWPWLA